MIKPSKPGYEKLSSNENWLLNNGASCHMTCNLELLENVGEIEPIIIGLPNGMNTVVKKSGTINLGPNLKSMNVLYVPSLTGNLVSILSY